MSDGGDRHTQTRQDGYAISGQNYQNGNRTFWIGSYTDAYGGGGFLFHDQNGLVALRGDGRMRAYEIQDANGVVRSHWDMNGLTFYDANGNVTKSYPST